MFSWKDSSSTAKLIIVFTAGFLVSLGMCGLTAFGDVGSINLLILEAVLLLISGLGLVVTLIVAFIHGTVTGGGSKPQTLFDDREEKK